MSFSIAEEEIRQIGPNFTDWGTLRPPGITSMAWTPQPPEVRRRFPSRLR